jgi:peptidoglycan/xylan/chitin deacetylase (PgdA/CDA1 family)
MTSIDPDHVDGAETGRLYRLASDRRARAWVGTVTILATLVAVLVALIGAGLVVKPPVGPGKNGAVAAAGYSADGSTAPADEPTTLRPVKNDCKGGTVTLTFDDGPYVYTDAVVERLTSLNMKGVFFMIGSRAVERKATVREVLQHGDVVANHTYGHTDLVKGNGSASGGGAWGPDQIKAELARGNDALVQAGAPRPTLYRPPYGSVNPQVDGIANQLGLRLVMSWGNSDAKNIIDTKDTESVGSERIADAVARRVRSGSIIVMHDGEDQSTLDTIGAFQGIADTLNAHRLCTVTTVPADATGGVLEQHGAVPHPAPAPAPAPAPGTGQPARAGAKTPANR